MQRRDFLKTLPIGLAASCIPLLSRDVRADAVLSSPMLRALVNPQEYTDRVAVIIWLEGGNDGLNTIIPFTDPLYDSNRQKTGFSQAADKATLVHKLRDDLAFNPAMSACFPLWQEGKMAVVQNVGLVNGDLSHFRATDIWNSASDVDQLVSTGWIARWMELDNPDYPDVLPKDPLAISMGSYSSPIYHGTRGQVDLMVGDPSAYVSTNASVHPACPPTYGGAQLKFVEDLISISDTYSTRFQSLFPRYAKSFVEYPDTAIARNLQKIAWCIASGLSTRVYSTVRAGFDTHFSENTKDVTVDGQGKYLKEVFDAIAAFQADLEAMGLADRVITMTYSEFGRRISENGAFDSGTDHGSCAPQFIIGSKVNGELYGHHPSLDDLDDNGNPKNEFEFRNVYASILGDWFGVSKDTAQAILTNGRTHDPFAMDFPVNRSGVVQPLIQRRASGVRSDSQSLSNLQVMGCYPNPCIGLSQIRFNLSTSANVTVELFDSKGSVVQQNATSLMRGEHSIPLDLSRFASGTYFYRLRAGSEQVTGSIERVR